MIRIRWACVNAAAQIVKLGRSAVQLRTDQSPKRDMSAHLHCRFLNQQVNRERRTQVCCEESAACSTVGLEQSARFVLVLRRKPTNGAAQINVGVTTSFVSLFGMAGHDELVSLPSLQPQSPHSHSEAAGLQQHCLAFAGFGEQQLFCF